MHALLIRNRLSTWWIWISYYLSYIALMEMAKEPLGCFTQPFNTMYTIKGHVHSLVYKL